MSIPSISAIGNKKCIAILDTSSVSFMERLQQIGVPVDAILKDYDLILIPGWVLAEIEDSATRVSYIENLATNGYPIYCIEEEQYSSIAEREELNLFKIVLASTKVLAEVKSYLRKNIAKPDPLDIDEYKSWIGKLYNDWPLAGEMLPSGRQKKKNAGEVSITILAEVIAWYCSDTDTITVYSQDNDTKAFLEKAEEQLRKDFTAKTPIPISYKSNDVIICQLYRAGSISEERIRSLRTNEKYVTYFKELPDNSIAHVTDSIGTEAFIKLIKDETVHIMF